MHPWAGVQCCKKQSQQAMGNKPVRCVSPCLFCSCLQIPALLLFFPTSDRLQSEVVRWNNPLLPQAAIGLGIYNKRKTKIPAFQYKQLSILHKKVGNHEKGVLKDVIIQDVNCEETESHWLLGTLWLLLRWAVVGRYLGGRGRHIRGQPGIQSKIQDSQGYREFCLKKLKEQLLFNF